CPRRPATNTTTPAMTPTSSRIFKSRFISVLHDYFFEPALRFDFGVDFFFGAAFFFLTTAFDFDFFREPAFALAFDRGFGAVALPGVSCKANLTPCGSTAIV